MCRIACANCTLYPGDMSSYRRVASLSETLTVLPRCNKYHGMQAALHVARKHSSTSRCLIKPDNETRVIKTTHKWGQCLHHRICDNNLRIIKLSALAGKVKRFKVSPFLSVKPRSAPSNIPKANSYCLPATPACVRLASYLNAKRLNVSRHVY